MSSSDPNPAADGPKLLTDEKGSGAVMVLVGGGLTGSLSFEPHQEVLREGHRAVRAQLLSVEYGLEARPLPEDYSVRLESAALGRAIDTLDVDGPIDLVAWSFGAFVTLDYALDHAERVRSLTLIEPPAFWVLEATGNMDEASQRERDALESLGDALRGDVSEAHLAEFVRAAGLLPPGTQPEALPSWPLWLRHRRSLLNIPAVFAHTDSEARLRQFDRPVLLVKGKGSAHAFRRIIDVLSVTLPQAQTAEFSGGHAPHIVEMGAFLTRLTEFQEGGS